MFAQPRLSVVQIAAAEPVGFSAVRAAKERRLRSSAVQHRVVARLLRPKQIAFGRGVFSQTFP